MQVLFQIGKELKKIKFLEEGKTLGNIQENGKRPRKILLDVARSQKETPFRRQTFPQNSHLTVMRWPLAMQYNIHAKPTRKPCDQTSSYRTREVRPCVHTYEITWAPLQNLPSERLRPTAISCSLPIFISLFSCITLTSKSFAQGALLGSPRAPCCLLRPYPSCLFFLKEPYPRTWVSMPHKTNAHSIDGLAWKHRFQGPVYKGFFTRARISDKQLAAASVYRVHNCAGRCITE